MIWSNATTYRGIIGGCYFANVAHVVRYNGDAVVTVLRKAGDGDCGVRVDLREASGAAFAAVEGDSVTLRAPSNYDVLRRRERLTVIGRENGRVVFDLIRLLSRLPGEPEFSLSLLTYLPNGQPLLLHPNRIKLGVLQPSRPNIQSLWLSAQQHGHGCAIRLGLDGVKVRSAIACNPTVTLFGPGGVVNRMRQGFRDQPRIGPLVYDGKSGEGAYAGMTGPCYLLDMGFEWFDTAIEVRDSTGVAAID